MTFSRRIVFVQSQTNYNEHLSFRPKDNAVASRVKHYNRASTYYTNYYPWGIMCLTRTLGASNSYLNQHCNYFTAPDLTLSIH